MTAQARPEPRSRSVLLTGATGFLGMEILARYVERTDRPIYALVRADSEQAAQQRVESTLRSVLGRAEAGGDQVIAVPGDIQRPALGIDPSRLELLAERVGTVIHAAASVSFSLPLAESRAINVAGTQRVLEFAELCRDRGGLEHFSYISTAYVAGTHTGQSAKTSSTSGRTFATPTNAPSSRPRSWFAHETRSCRSRCCGRASSWASAPAAGPPRSTCCTRR
jgi:thioester reductase-like protein